MSDSSSIAVNCPHCDGLFRIPSGVSGSATLECPHCQAESPASKLFSAVPMAKVSNTGSPSDEPSQAAPSIEVAGDPERKGHSFDDESYVIPKPLKTARRSSRSRSQRSGQSSSRKKQPIEPKRFGIIDVIKMALGGILAIPVAQLLLWWVFATDPFGMVKQVYPIFPAAVPPSLAPLQIDEEPDVSGNRDMPEGTQLEDEGIRLPVQ